MEDFIQPTSPFAQKRNAAYRNADSYFSNRETPVSLAKQQAVAQSVASDANTARLRALRLAREASNGKDNPSCAPAPKTPSRRCVISIKAE
jgi:hypothetical protein